MLSLLGKMELNLLSCIVFACFIPVNTSLNVWKDIYAERSVNFSEYTSS